MIEVIFLTLILLVVAYACARFLPDPIANVAAAIVALLALYVLVSAVLGHDSRLDL